MKIHLLFALLVPLQTLAQTFKESELETEIENVTVFLQGAQITRTGNVEIKSGKSILSVKSLSPHIDDKSIQVKAVGDFTILSVNHKYDYLNEKSRSARIDSLQNTIETLELEILSNKNRLIILSEKSSLLDANKDLGSENSSASLTQLRQAIDFYDQELSAIKKEELEKKIRIQDLEDQKSRIEKQIADVLATEDLPAGEIEIRINSETVTKGEFSISYLVNNAGWFPNYDVRVSNIEEPIELVYKADVYQNTGVDWDDVKLRFSNGNPNQSGVSPELNTWYLNYPRNTIYSRGSFGYIGNTEGTVNGRVISAVTGEPLPGVNVIVKGTTVGTVTDIDGFYQLTLPNNAQTLVYSFVGFTTMELPLNAPRIDVSLDEEVTQLSEVVVSGYGIQGRAPGVSTHRTSSAAKPKAETVITTAVVNQTTVEFEIETPYYIKSDGTKLTIDLTSFDMQAEYEYYAVPKLDKDAFLIARVIDWSQYNLLEGEANLFFEESFVGRSILDANSLADTLNISLGRDKSIVIGRTKNEDFSKRRTVGGNKIDTRGFEIIARNNKSEAIKLTLFDQIPVAAISDITISATDISNGSLNDETGQITWELNLAPGQQISLNLGYEVKYPKKESLDLE